MTKNRQDYQQAITQLTARGGPFELARSSDSGKYYAQAPTTLPAATAPARQYAEREFLIYEGERWSFKQLFDLSDKLAAAMQNRGVHKGDRVALAMRNYPEWMAVFLAVTAIGGVIVPINSWGQADDILSAINDAGARLVFCDQRRYDSVSSFLQDSGVTAVIVRPEVADHECALDTFCASCAHDEPMEVGINGDDLAMIMYTSGTSGRPKGAASTHRAICQALVNFECTAAAAAICNGETITAMLERGFEPTALLAVPLFHVSGCHAQFLTALRGGRRIVIMYKWDAEKALEYIERERVTSIAAAPVMLLDLLESAKFDTTDTSSLFSLGIGGAATPPAVTRLLTEKIPENFSGTGWGMTETNAQGASLTGQIFFDKPGSAGLPHPIVDIEIRNDEFQPVASGVIGEIWVRSCANIREYWQRPDANAEEFMDDWLKTGDLGYFDEEGFLFLADRAKDMVIRGGENIYPVEIEHQLQELAAVREVAALGLPDERWGEELVVVVRLHEAMQLTEASLLAHARATLAGYKVPSRVFFTTVELPRNPSNKLMKPVLKARLIANLDKGTDALV